MRSIFKELIFESEVCGRIVVILVCNMMDLINSTERKICHITVIFHRHTVLKESKGTSFLHNTDSFVAYHGCSWLLVDVGSSGVRWHGGVVWVVR